ncbi:MAG: hypothetical protein RIK87_00775 [Fuerstiella sp.]
MRSPTAEADGRSRPRFVSFVDVRTGLAWYVCSLIPVLLGVHLGFGALQPGREIPYGQDSVLLRWLAWDGGQFLQIMDEGYSFNPDRISNVVVFPGYPSVALCVRMMTGVSSAAALLLVSHVSLMAVLVFWSHYLRLRFPDQRNARFCGMAVLSVFPTTFFFRMAYSESLFLLLALLVLTGLQQGWRPIVIGLLTGAAVGVRLVGICLVPAVILFVLSQQRPVRGRVGTLALTLPLCLWGLGAYMLFLGSRFDNPLVFSEAQQQFFLRPPVSMVQHWYRLLTLEPVWGNYVRGGSGYWGRFDPDLPPYLSLQFANPVYFCVTSIAIVVGWAKRWLTDAEFAFGASLLLLAYIGRAEEFCMGCQARYAATALPAYLVGGRMLAGLPHLYAAVVLVIATSLLTVYSALFAAWYFLL